MGIILLSAGIDITHRIVAANKMPWHNNSKYESCMTRNCSNASIIRNKKHINDIKIFCNENNKKRRIRQKLTAAISTDKIAILK